MLYLGALVIASWAAAPFLLLLLASFTPQSELFQSPPRLIPEHPTLSYYLGLVGDVADVPTAFGQERLIVPALVNSLVIATTVTVVNLGLAGPASYALARFRFRGRGGIVNSLLASRMVPSLALLVPFYMMFRFVHLTDTLPGVVVAHVAISLPFTIWILRGHFYQVPIELERAARVDGCTRLGAFRHVALPLAVPGFVVAALFAFMISWNEFPLALVLTQSPSAQPVQPAIAGLYSYQGAGYGFLFAGTVLVAIPPALIALALQRYLVQGLLSGAVKG